MNQTRFEIEIMRVRRLMDADLTDEQAAVLEELLACRDDDRLSQPDIYPDPTDEPPPPFRQEGYGFED